MNIGELSRRLFSIHKCASCRSILDQKHFYDALCPKCMEIYRRARTESCPNCLRSAAECTCQPKSLSSAGSLCLRKLFFYHTDREGEAQNRLIFFLKHQPNARVEDFVASELLPLIREELSALGIEDTADGTVTVSVPRGKRAVLENGFDQSARMCRALSRRADIPYIPAIKRRFGGKEQKRLSSAERRRNIKSLMYADKKYADVINGKCVILFDDVVTTGASAAACLPILRKMGARGVICCSIAYDVKKKRDI